MGILQRAHWAASDYRANSRSAKAREAAHPRPPKSTSATVLGFVGRLTVGLLLLGFALDLVWPMAARDRFAGAAAHGACSARPQPHVCQDGVPTSALYGDLLQWMHIGP